MKMLVYCALFRIGCGAHFDVRSVYPGAPKPDGTRVSITIANGKTQMDFAGVIDASYEYGPPHTANFDQPDLHARDDPELYEDKWHAVECILSFHQDERSNRRTDPRERS